MDVPSCNADEQESVITNFLPVFILVAALNGSLLAGLLLPHHAALPVYVFPFLYAVFYFVTTVNKIPFPMYFFIAMVFVIGNNAVIPEGMLSTLIAIEIGIILLVSLVNLMMNWKKELPVMPEQGIFPYIKQKYEVAMASDPKIPLRITIHSFILFIAGFTGYLLQNYRGKWVLLACGAVLVGDQLEVLTKRAFYFIWGIILGCFLAGLIGYLHISLSVRVWIYIPAMIITLIFMPKVAENPKCYVIGSAMVALMAITGNSLSQQFITRDLIRQRFWWGMLGIVITILLTHIVHFVTKEIYR